MDKPRAKDVPDHIIEAMAWSVLEGLDEFYADPANEAAFHAWKRKKEQHEALRMQEQADKRGA